MPGDWSAWQESSMQIEGYRPPPPPPADGVFLPYETPESDENPGARVGDAPDSEGVMPDTDYSLFPELFSTLPSVTDLLQTRQSLSGFKLPRFDMINRAGAMGALHAVAARLKSSAAATAKLACGGTEDREVPVVEGPPIGLRYDVTSEQAAAASSAPGPEPVLVPSEQPLSPLSRLLSSESAGAAINLPLGVQELELLVQLVKYAGTNMQAHAAASLCSTVAATVPSSVAWHPLSMIKRSDYDALTAALRASMAVGSSYGRELPQLPPEDSLDTTKSDQASLAVEAWAEDGGSAGLQGLWRYGHGGSRGNRGGASGTMGTEQEEEEEEEDRGDPKDWPGPQERPAASGAGTDGGEKDSPGGSTPDAQDEEVPPLPPVVFVHPMRCCYVAWVGLPAAFAAAGFEQLVMRTEQEPDEDIRQAAREGLEGPLDALVDARERLSELISANCAAERGYYKTRVEDTLGDGYWLELYCRCLSVSKVSYKTKAVRSLVSIESKHRRTAPPANAREDTERLWGAGLEGGVGDQGGAGAGAGSELGQDGSSPPVLEDPGVDYTGDDEYWSGFQLEDGGPLAPKRRPLVVLPGMEAWNPAGRDACTVSTPGGSGGSSAGRAARPSSGPSALPTKDLPDSPAAASATAAAMPLVPLPGCLKVDCRQQMQYAAFLVGSRVLERCFGEPDKDGKGGGGDLHQQLIGQTRELWVFLARVGRLRPAQVTHLFLCSAGQHHTVARPLLRLLLAIVPTLPRSAREGVAQLVGKIPFDTWTDVTIQFCRDLTCVCMQADRNEMARQAAERAEAVADGKGADSIKAAPLGVRLYALPLLWRYLHDGSCFRAGSHDRSNGGAPPLAQVSTALAAIADIVQYTASGCGELWQWRDADTGGTHEQDMTGPFSEEHQQE